MKITNIYEVVTILLYFVFLLTAFGGTAYLVQVYNWSPWWFLFSALIFGSVSINTRNSK